MIPTCAQYCRLSGCNCFAIHSSMGADARGSVKKSFINGGQVRVLVLSYLKSNQGLNLHYSCRNSIIVERGIDCSMEHHEWSRVRRIGQHRTQRKTRLMSVATIDRSIEISHRIKQSPMLYALGVLQNTACKDIDLNADQVYDTFIWKISPPGVLATGPGNPPAVRVWTTNKGWFSTRPGQKPDPLTLGGPNLDPYPSSRGCRRVLLGPSVPISGSAFRVSHSWSHLDILLWFVKFWHWYVTGHFRRISRLDVQIKHTHGPNHILKMTVNRASTIFGLASSVIWVVLDHKHP